MSINSLNSFLEIADQFDLFWFDLWGVTHNGKIPFLGSIKCLEHLKKLKKNVWFLSNAPRLPEFAAQKLDEMGINRALYNGICTSGLVCHLDLKERSLPFYKKLKPNFYHLGPQRDKNIFYNIPAYKEVNNIEDADFLLITGTLNLTDPLDMYEPLLKTASKRQLPAICANADLEVMYGDQKVVCAGAITKFYQSLGCEVLVYGKPEKEIYIKAFELAQDPLLDKSKILMIGDSLYTDIMGANSFGIPSLLLGSGILEKDLKDIGLSALCDNYGAQPNYFMNYLKL